MGVTDAVVILRRLSVLIGKKAHGDNGSECGVSVKGESGPVADRGMLHQGGNDQRSFLRTIVWGNTSVLDQLMRLFVPMRDRNMKDHDMEDIIDLPLKIASKILVDEN